MLALPHVESVLWHTAAPLRSGGTGSVGGEDGVGCPSLSGWWCESARGPPLAFRERMVAPRRGDGRGTVGWEGSATRWAGFHFRVAGLGNGGHCRIFITIIIILNTAFAAPGAGHHDQRAGVHGPHRPLHLGLLPRLLPPRSSPTTSPPRTRSPTGSRRAPGEGGRGDDRGVFGNISIMKRR